MKIMDNASNNNHDIDREIKEAIVSIKQKMGMIQKEKKKTLKKSS